MVSKITLPSVKLAFLLHFAVSLIIFVALVAIMRLIWYPGDLFFMDGGWQGLKILAPIDLVLGPALTLCFYRPWKKNLKFDMGTIAAVQIAALSFGVYTTYQQRTAAIVFAENRFETLSLAEYNAATAKMREESLQPKSLDDFPGSMPVVLHAKSFTEDFGQYLADVMNGLPELRERSDRYSAIADSRAEIAEYRHKSQSGGTGIAGLPDSGGTVEIPASAKPATGVIANPAEIYPLKARYANGTIEFDRSNFEWIAIKREAE